MKKSNSEWLFIVKRTDIYTSSAAAAEQCKFNTILFGIGVQQPNSNLRCIEETIQPCSLNTKWMFDVHLSYTKLFVILSCNLHYLSMEKNPSSEATSRSASQEIRLLWKPKFIAVFTRARHWSLSWAKWIQSTPSHPFSLKSTLILSNLQLLHESRCASVYRLGYGLEDQVSIHGIRNFFFSPPRPDQFCGAHPALANAYRR
jgi:hypothetical protein